MASTAAAKLFKGNMKASALAFYVFSIYPSRDPKLPCFRKGFSGLRRVNLEGLRWRVFDAKGQRNNNWWPLCTFGMVGFDLLISFWRQVLGRLASQIATVVQGKDKPTYAPYREDGDMCIVLNAKDVCVTGKKLTDKVYRWHTGQVNMLSLIVIVFHWRGIISPPSSFCYILTRNCVLINRYVGHLKERSLRDQLARDSTEVIRKAVLRMLPRNKLRDDRDRKLRIFTGSEHPFSEFPLEPYVMPPRKVRELRPRVRRALIRAQKKEELEAAKADPKNKPNEDEVSA
ncbi:hypothetical protein QJS10_CPB04g01773 [Acorus calamus]|uniref:Ribosomal protein L13 n=1 Tax=Acorus calamus TaxID=4465 RepID=A0AAV9EYY8_ACOCL|nr:hypothetical protein QJS10_CPB04g01773 [Acorus calamus]